jgi:hypothetical protein
MMSAAAIYLVANRRSERDCANLVHSIRSSGCQLDIVVIPFGGDGLRNPCLLKEVRVMSPQEFPAEGRKFVEALSSVLSYCPQGFLRRFLAFFGPHERFIYSDNDVVALCDWTELLQHLDKHDLVHADEEYTTAGRFNFRLPAACVESFGLGSLERAITAGHFAAKRLPVFPESMIRALEWMRDHADACYLQDQTMMHIGALMGNWNCLNLCKEPHNWLSSWAGDYANTLALLHKVRAGGRISHLHYSGFSTVELVKPIDELLMSNLAPRRRLREVTRAGLRELAGLNAVRHFKGKIKRRVGGLMSHR